MPRRITVTERRARLARRHLLLPEARAESPAAVADAVVALHSSDPVSVHLSALARMDTPALSAVEAALYQQRSLIRHHAMRRTLWVATPAAIRVMHAAATRRVVATEHRRTLKILTESGIHDAQAWLTDADATVLAALREHGPMTARALGARLPGLAHPIVLGPGRRHQATVSAHTRVLLLLGFQGAVVRTRPTGTWINGEYTWSDLPGWLPAGFGDLDERTACRHLADTWLRRFGPGTTADLAWWAGWTATTTDRALRDAEAVQVDLDGQPAWVAPGDEDPVEDAPPWTALLPGLDPTTMGWKQRAWYLPSAAADAFDRNGNAGPTIWTDGQVTGAWAQTAQGAIRLHWFTQLPATRRREAEHRAEELAGWVGDTRFTVRFPSPIHTRLIT
jgi:hypothetical protein